MDNPNQRTKEEEEEKEQLEQEDQMEETIALKEQEIEEQKKPKKSVMKEMIEFVAYLLFIIIAAFFIYNYVGQQVQVDGQSMMDTLQDGEHLILEKISYRFGEPKRFDIVVFRPYEQEKDMYYIKRVIGLPGETIQIIGSDIYINGNLLEEDYGKEEIQHAGIAAAPITLENDEYFLMGDNRNNSIDSRDERVGIVKRKAIIGRAWVRIWPFDRLGILSHQ